MTHTDLLLALKHAAAGFATIRDTTADEAIAAFALDNFNACRAAIKKAEFNCENSEQRESQ